MLNQNMLDHARAQYMYNSLYGPQNHGGHPGMPMPHPGAGPAMGGHPVQHLPFPGRPGMPMPGSNNGIGMIGLNPGPQMDPMLGPQYRPISALGQMLFPRHYGQQVSAQGMPAPHAGVTPMIYQMQ